MVFLDSVSYKNTTIADFAGNSCPKELLKLVRRMQREGFGPMVYTNNGQPEKCIEAYMPDKITTATIIAAYCQWGRVDEATAVFSELKDKDILCWTTMLVGYAKSGRKEGALLFNGML
ncbi:pentatricopeptide repeat-containing protein [Cucumis melo var. makuwa]|uniref:Pentatricopeptide repeat-containing protein n=1 Tax=Cucumis melo var. makuwa TaxID=1194695 RepID=A0A5D3BQ36_CUCMM|nr:pentatricopeptide repeat-containing protein [Cucumis melo var. makuwa]